MSEHVEQEMVLEMEQVDSSIQQLNWNQCILCQNDTQETLLCSADNPIRAKRGVGYDTLEKNIQRFQELGNLPMPLNLTLLDEGKGIADACRQHQAKWHRTCFTKFNNLQLQRTENRKIIGDEVYDQVPSKKKIKVTRHSSGAAATTNKDTCFFCGSGEYEQGKQF